jgi:hypothetical protein
VKASWPTSSANAVGGEWSSDPFDGWSMPRPAATTNAGISGQLTRVAVRRPSEGSSSDADGCKQRWSAPAQALAEAARVLAPSGSIWMLGKFYETPPGPVRMDASRVLTAIGGARLTLSLTATIAESPLRVSYRERVSGLADVIQLTLDECPEERHVHEPAPFRRRARARMVQ